jgi:hypothetical protein
VAVAKQHPPVGPVQIIRKTGVKYLPNNILLEDLQVKLQTKKDPPPFLMRD